MISCWAAAAAAAAGDVNREHPLTAGLPTFAASVREETARGSDDLRSMHVFRMNVMRIQEDLRLTRSRGGGGRQLSPCDKSGGHSSKARTSAPAAGAGEEAFANAVACSNTGERSHLHQARGTDYYYNVALVEGAGCL